MARKALIVEDDDGVATLLGEHVAAFGLTPVRARGVAEALARAAEPGVELVITDLVLADGDGFKLATSLRATGPGAGLPILLVSGVYRQLPVGFETKTKARFLVKPVDPRVLRDTVRELLAPADAMHGIQRGRFDRTPAGAVLVRLAERRATGVLEAAAGEVRRRVYLSGGGIRFALSNVRAENAGGMQLAAGTLAPEAFERAVAHARAARLSLPDALVATGAMSAEERTDALRHQVDAVVLGLLDMAGAEWTYSAADVEKQPDTRRSLVALVAAHGGRALTPEDARAALAALAGRLEGSLARSPALEKDLFALRGAWPGETLTPLASGKLPLAEIAARARPEDLPLLWAFVTSGLFAPAAPVAGAPTATPRPPPLADPDAGRTFTAEEQAARRFVRTEHERAADLTHYELLGVAATAGVEEIKRAYLERARRYHSDAYAGLDLGGARELLAGLFSRLNEANETLIDAERRAEYDVFLERRAKGLPTDVGAILQAESTFQRGELLLRAHKYAEACEQFREAVALNHSEAEFHAYLGYALYRAKGPHALEEARGHLKKALAEAPGLVSAHHFLGVLAKEAGAEDEAIAAFQKALAIDPGHEPSTRELRHLRQRRDQSGKGLLGRLFGR